MIWLGTALVFFAAAIGVVAWVFIRDRRYERKRTSEVFSPGLKEEIEEERADGMERREKFQEALKSAQKAEEDNIEIQNPKS